MVVSLFIIIFFPNITLCHDLNASFLLEPGKEIQIKVDYDVLGKSTLEKDYVFDVEEYLVNSTLHAKAKKTIA